MFQVSIIRPEWLNDLIGKYLFQVNITNNTTINDWTNKTFVIGLEQVLTVR